MRLRTHMLLVGLLTGVLIEGAWAGEPPDNDCPPPPPGPEFMPAPGGPATFEHRGPGPRGNFMIRVMPISEFDLDKDGRVSRNEIDRGLRERFEDADKDGDGALDPEEFADARPAMPLGPPPPMGPPHGVPLPPPGAGCACECKGHRAAMVPGPVWQAHHATDPRDAFNHVDWNLNGELSFDEFAAPIHQMALHLDRNGDGVIDADEMRGPVMFFGPGFGPPPEPPRDR